MLCCLNTIALINCLFWLYMGWKDKDEQTKLNFKISFAFLALVVALDLLV